MNIFRKNTYAVIVLLLAIGLQGATAATVDTVEVYSAAMKKKIKTVVIRPAGYDAAKALPVVYLLHGYSDNYGGWISKVPAIVQTADQFNMMIVCPDGGFSSWYWDSPVDPAFKYETYVSGELVKYIDDHYKTIKDRKGRAITGLSMGGHGAMYLAIRHQDLYGAAGSMSGGMDIRPFPNNWDMAKRLGTFAKEPARWEANTVINMLHLLTPNSLSILVDCGTEDFFYKANEALHEQLLYRNIPHDYYTRPGGHNWGYWASAIQYQLLFMHQYFTKK